MIDTDRYEGHTEGPWSVNDEIGLIIKHGQGPHDFVGMDNEANAQLMADSPLLLAEVKQLHHALVYVTAKIYMNKNGEPYDYEQLMDYCCGHIGEPDDMSGDLGRMLHEWNDEQ